MDTMNYDGCQVDLSFTGGLPQDTSQAFAGFSGNHSDQPNVLDGPDLEKLLDLEIDLGLSDGTISDETVQTIQGTTIDGQNHFDDVLQLTKDVPMQPPNLYTTQKPTTNNFYADLVPSEASPSVAYLSNLTYSGIYPGNTPGYAAKTGKAASVPDFVADTSQYSFQGGSTIESMPRDLPQVKNTHTERTTSKKKSIKIECPLNHNGKRCKYIATSQNDLDRHRITKHKIYKSGDIYYVCTLGGSKCHETMNFRKDNFRHHLKTKHNLYLSGKDERLKQFARRWEDPGLQNSISLNSLDFLGLPQSDLETAAGVNLNPEPFQIMDGNGNRDFKFSLGSDMNTNLVIRSNLGLVTGACDPFHEPSLELQNSQDLTKFDLDIPSSNVMNNVTDLYISKILSDETLLIGQDVYQAQGGNTDFPYPIEGPADITSQENTTEMDIDQTENPDADSQIKSSDEIEEDTQSPPISENGICLTDLDNSSNSQPSSHAVIDPSNKDQGPRSSEDSHFKPTELSMPMLAVDHSEEPQPHEQRRVGVQETLLSQESEEYQETLSSRSDAPNASVDKSKEFEIPDLEVEDEGEDVAIDTVASGNEEKDEEILRMLENLPEASKKRLLHALVSKHLKDGTRASDQAGATPQASSSSSGPNNPGVSDGNNAAKNQSQCDFCGRIYPRLSVLKKHMRRHMRPYPCLQRDCTRNFGSKSDWKRHDTQVHRDSRLFRLSRAAMDKQAGKANNGLREYEDINDSHDFWCGFCKKEITHANFYTHIERHVVPKYGQKECTLADWVPNLSPNDHGSGNK